MRTRSATLRSALAPRALALALALGLLAASLCLAGSARAEERPPPAQDGQPARPPPARSARSEPLSEEDKALLRELALLEKVDLLKNLELFEPARPRGRRKAAQ